MNRRSPNVLREVGARLAGTIKFCFREHRAADERESTCSESRITARRKIHCLKKLSSLDRVVCSGRVGDIRVIVQLRRGLRVEPLHRALDVFSGLGTVIRCPRIECSIGARRETLKYVDLTS